jgi:(S)-ureidoglycine aminohydrolase
MLTTRTRYERDHSLLTPDTFVRAALPGMEKAVAIVHASPVLGAGFTEYTVEFEASGSFMSGEAQMFVYVLEGVVNELRAGDYAYLSGGNPVCLRASEKARAVVIEKRYLSIGIPWHGSFTGSVSAIEPTPMMGDETVRIHTLIPADPAFDFAVNIMTFQPGAQLPMIEAHVMEHGLYMLEGEGIYKLADHWYPVQAGDFIWMAPYCPQWFGALGRTPAKYLIYKDWNRHPLQTK